jgi:CheY-like chemotaxis protein
MTNQQTHDTSRPGDSALRAGGDPATVEPVRPLVVLLVEDDALIRMDAADMLQELGHEVVEAEYGPDALAVLEQRPVDVLVTDIGLPGMSGTDLAGHARRLQPGIGVIFATGDTELESRDGQSGAQILCKPYDGSSLAESLRRVRG